jgi:hypothetical protein
MTNAGVLGRPADNMLFDISNVQNALNFNKIPATVLILPFIWQVSSLKNKRSAAMPQAGVGRPT